MFFEKLDVTWRPVQAGLEGVQKGSILGLSEDPKKLGFHLFLKQNGEMEKSEAKDGKRMGMTCEIQAFLYA